MSIDGLYQPWVENEHESWFGQLDQFHDHDNTFYGRVRLGILVQLPALASANRRNMALRN